MHILCRWHIFKNIKAKCHSSFKSEKEWDSFAAQWNKFIRSRAEDEYSENFTNLSKTWTTQTADYILANWLPLKTEFVGTYIDSHPHFGTTVTSRFECLTSYTPYFVRLNAPSIFKSVRDLLNQLSNLSRICLASHLLTKI